MASHVKHACHMEKDEMYRRDRRQQHTRWALLLSVVTMALAAAWIAVDVALDDPQRTIAIIPIMVAILIAAWSGRNGAWCGRHGAK